MESIHPAAFVAALVLVTIWHELGHWTAAWLVGVPVRRICVGMGPVLWCTRLAVETDLVLRMLPVGMSVAVPERRTHEGRMRRPLAHDLWMVAGGPLASLLLTGLLFAAARWGGLPEPWGMTLVGVGLLSAALALLNLIPIPGLDGGHLLLLGFAYLGRSLPPKLERRVHESGLNLVLVLALAPLLIVAWRT